MSKKWCGSCDSWKNSFKIENGRFVGECRHSSKSKRDFLFPVRVSEKAAACEHFVRRESSCCDAEDRGMDGGCRSCGDPCL